MPKVSVIIPAYNAMNYLPKAVESVLAQTFTDFEVLIIDDGSLDGIQQWAAQITDPRVSLISQPNQGVSVARNTGINRAQGEYVAFLDADDFWSAAKLEKQVACLAAHPSVGLVDTWITLANEQGEALGEVATTYAAGDVRKQLLETNLLNCGSTPLVRRCCFETVERFDPNLRFGEDWEMWTRIASHYTFAVIEEPLTFYRQHPGNTSKQFQQILPDLSLVIEKNFQAVPEALAYLKSRAYGRVNLYVAWKALESQDYQEAIAFSLKALKRYPQLIFSKSYVHLILLIVAKQLLRVESYNKLREVAHYFRKQLHFLRCLMPNQKLS
jgi:glycosyltransferase involved in cell wall biosynthesis